MGCCGSNKPVDQPSSITINRNSPTKSQPKRITLSESDIMMLAMASTINAAQERGNLIVKAHKSILVKIDEFAKAEDRENEDSLENREIDLCITMLMAGLAYHDQKFSGLYDELLLKMRLEFNLFVKIIPKQTVARLSPFFELYDKILQGPLGSFMVINSNSEQSVRVKKLMVQEFAKAFLAEVYKRRKQRRELNCLVGALLVLQHLTNEDS